MCALSVVIITYNEEKNIQRCLESVKDIADEIIIVDSYSDDKTVAICEQYNAQITMHAFNGFGKQKQFANSLATHDMILSMDADEALSEELREAVQNILQSGESDVYTMNRLTNFCGKWIHHGGWYPDTKIRLFKKNKADWNDLPVHEILEISKDARVTHLKGDLLHYSIESMSYHVAQINTYSSIAAAHLVSKHKVISLLHILFKPLVRFIKIYIIKLGFLDGFYGFVIARNSAFALFLRYAKAKEIKKKKKQ